jgi:hypothetical protein
MALWDWLEKRFNALAATGRRLFDALPAKSRGAEAAAAE